MRAGRFDITLETGAAWSRAVQHLRPGDIIPASTATPGVRYFVDGWPLMLWANTPASGGRVKLQFGHGVYSDIMLTVDGAAGIQPAEPMQIVEAMASFTMDDIDPDTGEPIDAAVLIPTTVAPDGLSVSLDLNATETGALSDLEGAHSWDLYTRTAQFDWLRILEGTLTIIRGDTR